MGVFGGAIIGLISFAITFILLWIFPKNYRNKECEGYISFMEAFKFTMLVIVFSTVISVIYSYIFNAFNRETKFGEVVRVAMEKGFTEPDPRDDLNGMDVARKILILSREVGLDLSLEDVVINNILPESCIKANSVDAFFKELEKKNDYFESMRLEAEQNGKVLRFIAKMEHGRASVGLESVDPKNPFFALDGSDNMISFTTDRYSERPLVIKGPGAGAEVTAAGVFAEIISISHFLG